MGSLAALGTDALIERVLSGNATGHREVGEQLTAANDAAWHATSPRLLELCRVRIATMLGCKAEAVARTAGSGVADGMLEAIAAWPTDSRFTEVDRVCLAFTEHYVMDVASLDDATVAAVSVRLGDEGTKNFVHALLVVEQRIRLRLVWDCLLGDR